MIERIHWGGFVRLTRAEGTPGARPRGRSVAAARWADEINAFGYGAVVVPRLGAERVRFPGRHKPLAKQLTLTQIVEEVDEPVAFALGGSGIAATGPVGELLTCVDRTAADSPFSVEKVEPCPGGRRFEIRWPRKRQRDDGIKTTGAGTLYVARPGSVLMAPSSITIVTEWSRPLPGFPPQGRIAWRASASLLPAASAVIGRLLDQADHFGGSSGDLARLP